MKSTSGIAIIGVGRLGGALALALSTKGFRIVQLISGDFKKAQKIAESIEPRPEIVSSAEPEKISAEIIFITTPDSAIQTIAENLAGKLKSQPVVFHTSGALSSEILQSLKKLGSPVGSFHPLASVSDPFLGASRFRGGYFCLEGDKEALEIAAEFVRELEGTSFSIAAEYKALYHAAAVMASGHATAVISAAIEALAACGLNEEKAQDILFPLISGTIENLRHQNPSQALTGTFARADVETSKRHLEGLNRFASDELLAIYRLLGLRSINLAAQQGADPEKLALMRGLLTEDKAQAGETDK